MKRIILGTGTIGAAMGALALLGAGSAAAAPDVVGMLYEDAVATIEEEGGTPKVSVTVGDRTDAMGDCIVTNAMDAAFVRPMAEDVYFESDAEEVLLTINCNRGAATATTPGASRASVAGREFTAAEEEAAAQQNEEEELTMAGELPGVPGQVAE
ncbi:MAG: hypothetical protein ACRDU5_09555 [Mycobacterium sp.]